MMKNYGLHVDEEGLPFTLPLAAVTALLFALGRNPNTGGLDLEKAGVKTDGARIIADEFMRTSAPHIYSAGDCTGPHEIVHIAVQQGEIAARNIAYQINGRAGSPLHAAIGSRCANVGARSSARTE